MLAAAPAPPVFVLNIHADYACRHSGACCTAGWHVPVDAERAHGIGARFGPAGLRASPDLPEGAAAMLAVDGSGACAFFDHTGGRLCSIHRELGHDGLPEACQQFPRVTLLDRRGTHVTLSHFCPTAADMLFRDDVGALDIMPAPESFTRGRGFSGFDARHTIPPFLRPGVALDYLSADGWDRLLVRAFTALDLLPVPALAYAAHAAEHLRHWKPGQRPLRAVVRNLLRKPLTIPGSSTWTIDSAVAGRLASEVADTCPAWLRPFREPDASSDSFGWTTEWRDFTRPIGRFLGAKAFAAWSTYVGEGLRTQVAMLAAAHAVLGVEIARQVASAGRLLDRALLTAAVRRTDLLLEHLASREEVARRLSRVESMTFDAFLTAIALKPATT